MKKINSRYVVLSIICFGILALGVSGGPNGALAGHINDSGTCTNCHADFAINSQGGSIVLSGAPSSYLADTEYPLTLTLNDPNAVAGGFQIVAVRNNLSGAGNNTQIGDFIGFDTDQMRISSIERLVHKTPKAFVGTSTTWSFIWKSPLISESPPANVYFYFVGNAVDLSTDTGGDAVYSGATSAIPLPITLYSFNAERKDNQSVALQWRTLTEVQSDYFEIENSLDGIRFEALARMEAKGNSNQLQTYSYTDEKPITNYLIYYRLKMVDIDGSVSYSSIISVKPSTAVPNIFYAEQKVWINFGLSTPQQVSIYSATGELRYEQNNFDTQQLEIALHGFTKGIYIVIVKENGRVYSKKIVVI